MKKKRGRLMRLPNGFGSVVDLGEGRRFPYGARTATSGYDEKGNAIRKYIGYYETYEEAYQALVEYNSTPYKRASLNLTFGDLAKILIERKEYKELASLPQFKSYYKHCKDIENIKAVELNSLSLQKWLDTFVDDYKYSTISKIRGVAHQVMSIADELNIIPKNPVQFIEVHKADDTVSCIPLKHAELDLLWQNVDKVRGADMLIVMCYSGFRALAYKDLKVNLDELYFQGGVKTAAGRNRIVPIHHRIIPIVQRLVEEKRLFGWSPEQIRTLVPEILTECKIDVGEFPYNHTPHDFRATFTTNLIAKNVPRTIVDKLSGHASGTLTEDIYTSLELSDLRTYIEYLD